MSTLQIRLMRATGLGVTLMLGGTICLLGQDWVKVVTPARFYLRNLVIGLLEAFLPTYIIIVVATIALAVIFLGSIFLTRTRSRLVVARGLLLCGSILLAVIFAEGVAAVYLFKERHFPALSHRFTAPVRAADEILIVVAGESSALGVPYEHWLSVGTIICRELQKAIPSHRFRVEILAEKGATLERMHGKLASLTERPDAIILFSGHNEFLGRFSLMNRVAYYVDERSGWHGQGWFEHAGRFSPLYTLVRENLEKHRVSVMPGQSLGITETMVGHPICTADAASMVIEDFHRRLEAIVTECEQIGCLPILIIPPGNDASPPNLSCASPSTDAVARQTLARRLLETLTIEKQDPNHAITAYRQIIDEQPAHAWAHYRLARLLSSAGLFAEAKQEFILARDQDGLPLRSSSRLEAIYERVGHRHPGSILIDGPAVLSSKSRHGILDAELFHDNVHPNLAGHTALAEAVLAVLKARAAFGWPVSTPAPVLDAQLCADEFGIDGAVWATVCERSAAYFAQIACFSSDLANRIEWRDRYATAARQIRAGARPEDVGIPGVGVATKNGSRRSAKSAHRSTTN